MKKSLIALFVAAFCITSMAQVLVYDYKASIKRLELSMASIKVNGNKVYLDSAKVKSDKIEGIVLIEACKECGGKMEQSGIAAQNARVFVTLKSNKGVYAKDLNAYLNFAMWGKKTGSSKSLTGVWYNADKFSEATGVLYFDLSKYAGFFKSKDESITDPAWNVQDFAVTNCGFGKVKVETTESWNTDPCNPICTESSCYTLKDLSGSTTSYAQYTGVCSEFLFDVCDLAVMKYAAIPGTFTLKLDKSASKEFGTSTLDNAATAVEASLIADGMVEAATL